jgi:hypothetical protein
VFAHKSSLVNAPQAGCREPEFQRCVNAATDTGSGMKILFLSLLMASIVLASHYGTPKRLPQNKPQARR